MILEIKYNAHPLRRNTLLQGVLGPIYFIVPHIFLLFFLGLWDGVLEFTKFFTILFTEKFPDFIYRYQNAYLNRTLKFNVTMENLIFDYPSLGSKNTCESVVLEFEKPQWVNRSHLLFCRILGPFIMFPHNIIIIVRTVIGWGLESFAFFSVLITGKYPSYPFYYKSATIKKNIEIILYMKCYTLNYPSFCYADIQKEAK